MRVSLWLYLIMLIGGSAAALFAVDRIIKVGTKGSDADITLEGIFFAGLGIVLTVVAVTITAFTGSFLILFWTALLLAAFFGTAYAWRSRRAAGDRELKAEMTAVEEARVLETARLDPLNASAWERLSEICEEKRDYPKAMEYLEKACELEPSQLKVHKMKSLKESAGIR